MSTVVSNKAGLRNLSIITGLVAFVLFILTPFLPVNQTQASVSWPQNGSLNSVNAPLISVAPEELHASIPLAAREELHDAQSLLLSTVPADSPQAADRGLLVRATDQGLDVVVLNEVVFALSAAELARLPEDAVLELSFTGEGAEVAIPGTQFQESTEEDMRPQVTGVYTEIADTGDNHDALVEAGLAVDVEVNSRFTSTPSGIKVTAMWAGAILTIISLAALWRSEREGRPRRERVKLGRGQRPVDITVGLVLAFWYIFGANTSDDGFTTVMARVSENAGYMANYYRWYGVPESPFGSPYYDLLGLLSQVTAASLWMRLPSIIAAILIWWLLSRVALPLLGEKLAHRGVAQWSAALVFLAFWLPYNNGTRPEPMVALGALAAWVLFERAIATRQLFPAAIGTIVAAFTLTVGPTGLLAVGAFLVALPALFRILTERRMAAGGKRLQVTLATLAPFLAGGTSVLVPVFADQTFAAVMESTRVRGLVGPALDWYSEYVRYATLFQQTVDGSLTRRFPMFILLVSIALIIYALIKHRQVPGAAKSPTARLMVIIALSFFFLMFTPTKWTHHFGIYAGLAPVVAALAAVVLQGIVMQSARARTFTWAGFLFLLALTFAGWNGWWYVSSFAIPWWDKTPQFRGVEFSTIILLIAIVVAAIGLWQSMRHDAAKRDATDPEAFRQQAALPDTRGNRVAAAPIAITSALIVLSAVASFGKGFIEQYPAYSVGLGNLRTLAGNTCSLADEAMVETNTNDAFLTPVGSVELGESLEAGENQGFHPDGVPHYFSADVGSTATAGAMGAAQEATDAATDTDGTGSSDGTAATDAASTQSTDDTSSSSSTREDEEEERSGSDTTGGTRATPGVNGSTAALPFDIAYEKVPVMGSWISDEPSEQYAATITTAWYELPEATETAPLLVISAAGEIEHVDANGVEQPGESLVLEYGQREGNSVTKLGETQMLDIGPSPTWRNLRLPLDSLPEEADAVRIVAEDRSLDPNDWIAFVPPRVPELAPLSSQFGPEVPAQLDWSAALQFPCVRPFDHYAGVTEIPEYRVSPDHPGKAALTGFMDFYGGGSMSTVEAVNTSVEIPSYTKNDPHRDWGSAERYELRTNSQGIAPDVAEVSLEEIQRSGLWHESDMKIRELD